MSTISMVVGATASDGATFVAKVEDGPVRIAVADNAGMTSPTFFGPESVDADNVAKVTATGLAPSTRYWWQVEDDGVLDTAITGQVLTYPAEGSQSSHTIAVASCAGNQPEAPGEAPTVVLTWDGEEVTWDEENAVFGQDGGLLSPNHLSNHPVFDTIRERALAEDWLFFGMIGDLAYYDPGSGAIVPDASVGTFRTMFDDVLLQPRQHQLYRELTWVYGRDDHDGGPNNWDSTFVDKDNGTQVYRERVPHYPLDDANAIYQSFQIGRVLYVLADTRYHRSPNSDPDDASKTMLGAAQKAWLENLLTTTSAEALVWLMQDPWIATGTDTWGQFRTERAELVDMLAEHDWLRRMVMVHGDRHVIGLTGGATNDGGGFPVMNAASLDASNPGSTNPDWFDVVPETPGRNQYGTVTVTDLGSVISIRLAVCRGADEVGNVTMSLATSTPPSSFVGEMAAVVHGSHRATFEARVLDRFQFGNDPDGVEIPILDGEVTYDGTAQVFASLELTTSGLDERRRSLFPRVASDLLAPYGREVFVRRGVDLGSEIVWVPLGYFRLDDDEQLGASDGPIRLSGQDRMSGIIDGELITPRQFAASRTVESAVLELVTDIYPSVVVFFDDTSGQEQLGRQVIVERDRYAALLDIVESIGKVMAFDGEGILRITDAPGPDDLVWDIRAGYQGVLVDANRRASREGMANGVVAIGEGGDTNIPVRAVAVDAGPNSPTRWFPPEDPDELWFGQVPHFYSSPLVTTAARGRDAAAAQLRRRIGMPYSVQFTSIVNPALRPRQAVRVTQKDGTRERHIIDTYTVPLSADRAASGTTREQTSIRIAQVVPVAPILGSE